MKMPTPANQKDVSTMVQKSLRQKCSLVLRRSCFGFYMHERRSPTFERFEIMAPEHQTSLLRQASPENNNVEDILRRLRSNKVHTK